MLKIIFWTLLLGNGALFAYHQGHLDAWFGVSHEPARLAREINPDQIKLLPAPARGTSGRQSRGAASGSDALAASPAITAPAPLLVTEKKTDDVEPRPELIACTEIGNFTEPDAARFETQLASLVLGARLSRRIIRENGSYMVYMPPQGNKENADKKVAQLRSFGVTDFYVIQDNPELRWGISLGIFRTEEAAKARLAQLTEQGVRSARLGARNAASKVAFQLRAIDPAARENLLKIKADYPQQLRNCS